ncbi:MAG: site-specific DNA-methyltransferase [Acidobacteria bacterium]|nr:site-specific DNA-methyltransferase [Acidobacteriota bacterium]
MARTRRGTRTSDFGTSKREGHDASDFYERFPAPIISDDESITPPVCVDEIFVGDAREILADERVVADNSVALVVTSPPYFAGKQYEADLTEAHVPASYVEYLEMLEAVLAGCLAKLEPGGRMAVNVANLGRKPYRSLSSDVIHILQDRLGMLLRGEIVWQKGKGLNGSCAWGSFQSASNPVLRDTTERVIVASKGRFARAHSRRERAAADLPADGSMFKEDFMDATTDVWEIATESATRVGHPAPFPVELPRRLIDLYTFRGDLVLDPFMGSGSSAMAALRTDRHYVGFDTDRDYVDAAKDRLRTERERLDDSSARRERFSVYLPAVPEPASDAEDGQARAVREGRKAKEIASLVLSECGFEVIAEKKRQPSGAEIDFVAKTADGSVWHIDVSGAFTSGRAGLRRTDTLWKSLGRAAVRDGSGDESGHRYLLITTHLPASGSAGHKALRTGMGNGLIFDAVEMLAEAGQQRLADYSADGGDAKPPTDLHKPEFDGI